MASIFRDTHRFLGLLGIIAGLVASLVLFANASKDVLEKPKFTYVERFLVKITYVKGVNRSLYVCCNTTRYPAFLAGELCGFMSKCPDYDMLLTCKTKGQQVCCEVKGVIADITVKGYVGKAEGNTSVPLSEIATYVTNLSEKIPKSVSNISVTTNQDQGLNITWLPLTIRDYSASSKRSYTHVVHCQPLKNKRAKAVRENLDITNSQLVINSKNLTAISKYRCCVMVENVLTSLVSEPTCQNITTTEKAPSAGPVIVCGNGTIQCLSEVRGEKRNITMVFELPSPENRNGKIIRSEVYYRKVTSGNFTKLIVNGSVIEAVITDAETGTSYDVFMKSCTKIGCSPISNTVRIPAFRYIDKITEASIVIVPAVVASLVVLALVAIVCCVKRHQRLQRTKLLPVLKPKTDPSYQYPVHNGPKNEIYHELDVMTDDKDDVTGAQVVIVANPMALATENA